MPRRRRYLPLSVTLTGEQIRWLERKAEMEDTTISDYLRKLIDTVMEADREGGEEHEED